MLCITSLLLSVQFTDSTRSLYYMELWTDKWTSDVFCVSIKATSKRGDMQSHFTTRLPFRTGSLWQSLSTFVLKTKPPKMVAFLAHSTSIFNVWFLDIL
jgi:hypothetical protein